MESSAATPLGYSAIVEVAVAVILRADGSFLLARRPEGKPYAGYWEFPGGKVQPGESLLHALKRELWEELDITVEHAYRWLTRTFTYPHATVRLCFFRITEWRGPPRPCENQQLSWQYSGRVEVEPLLPANAPVLRALELPVVYAVTNALEAGTEGIESGLAAVERALHAGARLIQIREKRLKGEMLRRFASETVRHACAQQAIVVVNGDTGDADFCREIGADGLHLPSHQLMSLHARPDVTWCGASCHNAEEIFRAEQLSMDFIVLGPVLPTLSHPYSSVLGWRKFGKLIENCSLPVFALGGLRSEDLETAWEAGAHGIAMMSAFSPQHPYSGNS
ncbi:MAG TPA: Nudix family hydrolase [Nitrosospira sp.]|nr:Nudix family hydrolase [Nitrosospira sp.]